MVHKKGCRVFPAQNHTLPGQKGLVDAGESPDLANATMFSTPWLRSSAPNATRWHWLSLRTARTRPPKRKPLHSLNESRKRRNRHRRNTPIRPRTTNVLKLKLLTQLSFSMSFGAKREKKNVLEKISSTGCCALNSNEQVAKSGICSDVGFGGLCLLCPEQ